MIDYTEQYWMQPFRYSLRPRVNKIINLAFNNEYSLIKIDYNTGMLRFKKDDIGINVYATKMTVTTEINHPKKGKTQLHRKTCTMLLLETIFSNPRIHTGKGYYTNN